MVEIFREMIHKGNKNFENIKSLVDAIYLHPGEFFISPDKAFNVSPYGFLSVLTGIFHVKCNGFPVSLDLRAGEVQSIAFMNEV